MKSLSRRIVDEEKVTTREGGSLGGNLRRMGHASSKITRSQTPAFVG